jgi:hypothetical protein
MKKKIFIGVGVLAFLLAAAVVAALYVYPKPQIASATHQPAPDFTLSDGNGSFSLSSQRGHEVVLYFYRGYW